MKKQIKIKQKDSEVDFKKIKKVNFVDVNAKEIIIEIETK